MKNCIVDQDAHSAYTLTVSPFHCKMWTKAILSFDKLWEKSMDIIGNQTLLSSLPRKTVITAITAAEQQQINRQQPQQEIIQKVSNCNMICVCMGM